MIHEWLGIRRQNCRRKAAAHLNLDALEWILDGNGERFIPHWIEVFVHGLRFVQQPAIQLELHIWIACA